MCNAKELRESGRCCYEAATGAALRYPLVVSAVDVPTGQKHWEFLYRKVAKAGFLQ